MMLALAAAPLTITVNGTRIQSDVPPLIQRGRLLLPARAVFSALGADVSYDGKTGHVMVRRGPHVVQITLDSTLAFVDGGSVRLDVPAQIYDGRTMVPLRFVAQALGETVTYEAAARTVAIVQRSIVTPPLVSYGNPNAANAGAQPNAQSYAQPNIASTAPPPPAPPPYAQPDYTPQQQLGVTPLGAAMNDDEVQIAFGGPPGGSGYVNLCGYGGNVPLNYDPQRGVYYAQLPFPYDAYRSACYVTGYFYDQAGRIHYLSLPSPFLLDTRTRRSDRPRPTPSPSPTPSPRPTSDPAHTRNLLKASPSPSPTPAPRVVL
jgi:hypothetical protein